jgi:predicted GTPase
MFPISAEHGRGIDDLLDAVFEVCLPPRRELTAEDAGERLSEEDRTGNTTDWAEDDRQRRA